MEEKMIEIDYETIGVKELRHLHELSNLNKAMNFEDYLRIVGIYYTVILRLEEKIPKEEEQ